MKSYKKFKREYKLITQSIRLTISLYLSMLLTLLILPVLDEMLGLSDVFYSLLGLISIFVFTSISYCICCHNIDELEILREYDKYVKDLKREEKEEKEFRKKYLGDKK